MKLTTKSQAKQKKKQSEINRIKLNKSFETSFKSMWRERNKSLELFRVTIFYQARKMFFIKWFFLEPIDISK